ncbi:MAG: dimethyl sulfoxide reductase anchor subunit, partial [Deltaproteobacteria bacterium]|nr:dimethyl sulfoxide reductase anchor subunit [Deltaproteobacteria bacterium]
SWLSREILATNILAGILVIMVGLAHMRPGVLTGWLLLPGSLAGAATLYAMTRVYRLRTVPSWNHAGTSLAFPGSALLLGGLLGMLILTVPALFQAAGLEASGHKEYRSVAQIAILAGFILNLLASGIKPSGAAPAEPLIARQPLLQGIGVALGMVYILAAGNPVFQSLLLLFTVACLVSGEIIQRIQFYRSYQRVGL